jgi:hypothetical protein
MAQNGFLFTSSFHKSVLCAGFHILQSPHLNKNHCLLGAVVTFVWFPLLSRRLASFARASEAGERREEIKRKWPLLVSKCGQCSSNLTAKKRNGNTANWTNGHVEKCFVCFFFTAVEILPIKLRHESIDQKKFLWMISESSVKFQFFLISKPLEKMTAEMNRYQFVHYHYNDISAFCEILLF